MLLAKYLYFILWFFPLLKVQSATELSARSLDSLLQDYAFRALVRPKTGIVYDGDAPSNLTGIKLAALRLRSGSLRRKGFSSYKEFHIPIGVLEQPYVERLVLVYHNLANWSSLYYPLPGYTYLAPILGLLAYNAADLSARNLPELDIRASGEPITIHLPDIRPAPEGFSPKCIYFGLDGSVEFNNVINKSACSATKQGHFSIGVESPAPAPAPAPALSPAPAGGGGNIQGGGGQKVKHKVWIIVGSVVGGVLLLALLSVLFGCLGKYRKQRSIQRMEEAAERGEPLLMANVGRTKAPVAMETRTRPSLEDDYVP